MDSRRSINGILIRLPDERWNHIVEEHAELVGLRAQVLETIAAPERILRGNQGEQLAVRQIEPGKWLIAVYRELGSDGFIITAFMTRRASVLTKREKIWP